MKIAKKYTDIIITKKQINRSKAGGHGFYIKLDKKVGVKVIGTGSKSLDKLIKSSAWIRADMENETYNVLRKSQITPKFAKLVIVQSEDKYYPGIVMEHINGKTIAQLQDNPNKYMKFKDGKIISTPFFESDLNIDQMAKYFNKLLKSNFGIYNDDIHGNNMIVTSGGKIKIVDFSPGYSGPVD